MTSFAYSQKPCDIRHWDTATSGIGTQRPEGSSTRTPLQLPDLTCSSICVFSVSHPHLPVLLLFTPITEGPDPGAQAKAWEQAEAWNKQSARPSRKAHSGKAHIASIKGG